MREARESFSQRAEKAISTAQHHLTEDPRDMRISEVSSGIAQALATMTMAQEQARTNKLLAELVKVQVPPETVPRHVYDSVIDKIIRQEARLAELGDKHNELA